MTLDVEYCCSLIHLHGRVRKGGRERERCLGGGGGGVIGGRLTLWMMRRRRSSVSVSSSSRNGGASIYGHQAPLRALLPPILVLLHSAVAFDDVGGYPLHLVVIVLIYLTALLHTPKSPSIQLNRRSKRVTFVVVPLRLRFGQETSFLGASFEWKSGQIQMTRYFDIKWSVT